MPTLTPRTWSAIGAAAVAVVVAVTLFLVVSGDGDDAATDAPATTSSTDGSTTTAADTSTTAALPSTTAPPGATGQGFASPRDLAADRYGSAYLGACEAIPADGAWAEGDVCTVEVALSTTEVVLLAGPPYSEVLEDLLLRLDGGTWTLADRYVVGELGVDDPDEPAWVREAVEIKDGLRAPGA
ncbi:MAG TPA: hypothetical protein VFZ79_06060 [Acidimicrobiales bacterium]